MLHLNVAYEDLGAAHIFDKPINFDVSEQYRDDEELFNWTASFERDIDGAPYTFIVRDGSIIEVIIHGNRYESHEHESYWDDTVHTYRTETEETVLDAPAFDALFDVEVPDCGPQMNYIYPINPSMDAEVVAANLAGLPLVHITVPSDGDAEYLCLSGGGTDLTWEICTAYVVLGCLPPIHYARELPGIAGRGKSEADKYIVGACLAAMDAGIKQLGWRREQLAESAARWSA